MDKLEETLAIIEEYHAAQEAEATARQLYNKIVADAAEALDVATLAVWRARTKYEVAITNFKGNK